MKVRDALDSKATEQVHWIRPEATIQELLDGLAEHNIGAMLVSGDGRDMIGIVSERDIVRKLRGFSHTRDLLVNTIMTPADDVHICGPDDSFRDLLALMTEHRVRHVPVVDNDGIVGIVSIGDAVKTRMDQLKFERDQLSQYVSGG